jgi:hypothetical protein
VRVGGIGAASRLARIQNAIIDSTALPLTLVEQNVDRWIAAEKARGG